MVEIRQFRYFVAVAEERDFGRAAQRLGIGQSALSQAIAQLEAVLEVRLLDRKSRRVELTPAGEAFLVGAGDTLTEVQRAVEAVGAVGAHDSVPVSIAATLVTAMMVVPAVAAELERRAPDVEIEVTALPQIGILGALDDGHVDIGFATHPLPPASLQAELVRRDPAVVVVGPRNALARRRTVPLSLAARQPLVIWARELAPGYYDRVLSLLADEGVVPELAVHSSAGPSSAVGVDWGGALAESGFALMPRGAPHGPDAIHVELVDPPVLETYVLWRAGDERRAVTETVEAVRTCARERAWLTGM
jgi:DNA-binding transcriptional LysR family regulator